MGFDDTISTENRNSTQFEEQQTSNSGSDFKSQDQRTQSSYKEKNMLSVGAHYCNSNTREAEAGSSELAFTTELKYKASVGFVRVCL